MYLAKTKAQSAARLPHSWSATLVFAFAKDRFSHDVAHLLLQGIK